MTCTYSIQSCTAAICLKAQKEKWDIKFGGDWCFRLGDYLYTEWLVLTVVLTVE